MQIQGLSNARVARLYGSIAPRPAQGLVAGGVGRGVSFEPSPAASRAMPRQTLPLYTRAADKIEVEVALRGRTVDLTA